MSAMNVRQMPTLTATWSEADQRWTLVLPDGHTVTGSRCWVIERHVRRHAPGTAIRWYAPRVIDERDQPA